MEQERSRALVALAARRWRIALVLTASMLVTYFGFVLLVAYDKPLLGRILAPGLSVGILLGVLVILVAWALTGIYVGWANRVYDAELARARVIGDGADPHADHDRVENRVEAEPPAGALEPQPDAEAHASKKARASAEAGE